MLHASTDPEGVPHMWEMILHPFAVAIAWVWIKIHDLLALLGMGQGSGLAWVLSIVLLTIFVRALVLPLYFKQIKSSRSMQLMQPELKKLQEKYKGKTDTQSRQKMAEEQQALYKKHGANPLASCLPMLVQMPILFAMYRAIFAIKDIAGGTYTYRGEPADHLGPITQQVAHEIDGSTVFGVQLSLRITDGISTVGLVTFAFMIVAMVFMQWFSLRLTMTRNMPAQTDPNNPMVRSQKVMLYMMPIMFIFTGFFFQMGLLVYMVTSAAWALGQAFWVVNMMPTPGSPAYISIVHKRQNAYQTWARPYFAELDAERATLAASDSEAQEALTIRALNEVKTRARRQKIASHFPEEMSEGEILTVYRTLSVQEWDTLPDELWMRAIHRATARSVERRAQKEMREQNKRLTREQRRRQSENQSQSESSSRRAQVGAKEITPEEIERRRQERKKAQRRNRKKRD
ncbi:membrane protein insertase YidC [Schaalia sp. lx-100]|uniref:membrane protein insertase YidC n=1 Tax=Schaalia sp. lx-100 TaxID=2899081 RepID=UPI002F2B1E4B